jgi:hypothetical protein
MDHEDGELLILGLVKHAGVKVVDLAVFDSGVWHIGGCNTNSLPQGLLMVYYSIPQHSFRLRL